MAAVPSWARGPAEQTSTGNADQVRPVLSVIYLGITLCWAVRLLGLWLGFRYLRRAAEPALPGDPWWLFWLTLGLGIAFPVVNWWVGSNARMLFNILSTRPKWEIPRSGWRLAAFVLMIALLVGGILALILVEPPTVPDVLRQQDLAVVP